MSGTTYTAATTAKLNREDLSDIISVVDARSTIVTSMIKKGKKPESALSEWIVDSYGSAKTSGVVDGTDASGSTTNFEDFSSNRKRAQNYLQTFRRTPLVTRLQEIVAQPAGISNPDPNGASGSTEFGRAKSKAVIQLKRDIESQIVLNQLYKHTQLETTFGIIMLALVDNRPKVKSELPAKVPPWL